MQTSQAVRAGRGASAFLAGLVALLVVLVLWLEWGQAPPRGRPLAGDGAEPASEAMAEPTGAHDVAAPPEERPSVDGQHGSVFGRVVDADGEPIPSALVELFAGGDFRGRSPTDAQGRYGLVGGWPAGASWLVVSSVGAAPAVVALERRGSRLRQDLLVGRAPARTVLQLPTGLDARQCRLTLDAWADDAGRELPADLLAALFARVRREARDATTLELSGLPQGGGLLSVVAPRQRWLTGLWAGERVPREAFRARPLRDVDLHAGGDPAAPAEGALPVGAAGDGALSGGSAGATTGDRSTSPPHAVLADVDLPAGLIDLVDWLSRDDLAVGSARGRPGGVVGPGAVRGPWLARVAPGGHVVATDAQGAFVLPDHDGPISAVRAESPLGAVGPWLVVADAPAGPLRVSLEAASVDVTVEPDRFGPRPERGGRLSLVTRHTSYRLPSRGGVLAGLPTGDAELRWCEGDSAVRLARARLGLNAAELRVVLPAQDAELSVGTVVYEGMWALLSAGPEVHGRARIRGHVARFHAMPSGTWTLEVLERRADGDVRQRIAEVELR